jgi:hypothetical protein
MRSGTAAGSGGQWSEKGRSDLSEGVKGGREGVKVESPTLSSN